MDGRSALRLPHAAQDAGAVSDRDPHHRPGCGVDDPHLQLAGRDRAQGAARAPRGPAHVRRRTDRSPGHRAEQHPAPRLSGPEGAPDGLRGAGRLQLDVPQPRGRRSAPGARAGSRGIGQRTHRGGRAPAPGPGVPTRRGRTRRATPHRAVVLPLAEPIRRRSRGGGTHDPRRRRDRGSGRCDARGLSFPLRSSGVDALPLRSRDDGTSERTRRGVRTSARGDLGRSGGRVPGPGLAGHRGHLPRRQPGRAPLGRSVRGAVHAAPDHGGDVPDAGRHLRRPAHRVCERRQPPPGPCVRPRSRGGHPHGVGGRPVPDHPTAHGGSAGPRGRRRRPGRGAGVRGPRCLQRGHPGHPEALLDRQPHGLAGAPLRAGGDLRGCPGRRYRAGAAGLGPGRRRCPAGRGPGLVVPAPGTSDLGAGGERDRRFLRPAHRGRPHDPEHREPEAHGDGLRARARPHRVRGAPTGGLPDGTGSTRLLRSAPEPAGSRARRGQRDAGHLAARVGRVPMVGEGGWGDLRHGSGHPAHQRERRHPWLLPDHGHGPADGVGTSMRARCGSRPNPWPS